jgi:hypothetical protein
MAAEIAAQPAPQDSPGEGELLDKIEALARLCTTLQGASQRVSAESGLARTRLGTALAEALLAREAAGADARALAMTGYRAVAAGHTRPRRYNRIARRIDNLLDRLPWIGRAMIIDRSGLWADERGKGRLGAMAAYARRGGDPSAQPQALFDQSWYLKGRPDLAGSAACPLTHYLLHGAAEGADPHPLFDTGFYAARNAAELGACGLSPLEHFVRVGAGEGRDPHPLFDVAYYVRQAPDLIATGENPLLHYLRTGAARGLNPHPLFASDYYASQLAASGIAEEASLLHYLTAGSALGLKPHPLFDPAWYREQYPDVVTRNAEPLIDFVTTGGEQGRSPGPWFDTSRYLALRAPAGPVVGNPLVDYLHGGAWRISEPWLGRPSLDFVSTAAEFAGWSMTPLEHWARQGGGQIPNA